MAVSLAPVSAGGQGSPIEREKYSFEFGPELDPDASAACGIDIYVEGSGHGTVSFYADGSIVDHYNERFLFTSPDTDESVIRTAAATLRSRGEESFDEETQTVTINFDDTFVGLPSKWRQVGNGVLLRDAGWANFVGSVVLDVSDPDDVVVLSLDETIVLHGPHPEIGADLAPILCPAIGA